MIQASHCWLCGSILMYQVPAALLPESTMEEQQLHLVRESATGGVQLVEKEDSWDGFDLPFPVATLTGINQRAYITENDDAEWLWTRVHTFCAIQKEPGRMLRDNKNAILETHDLLQVPRSDLHYRGAAIEAGDQQKWSDHTMGSKSVLVTLLWIIGNRGLKATSKLKALNLMLDLVNQSFTMADHQQPIMGMICSPEGRMVSKELFMTPQAICREWAGLLATSPGAMALWKALGQRCWLNRCIASSPETASLMDIWFYLAYLSTHKKLKQVNQNLWLCFGKLFLPNLLFAAGRWLTALALKSSREALQLLPILKKKTGNARRIADPVNKILLLWKLRKEKLHRNQVARSHGELGGNTSRMMVFESYLDCLLHMRAMQEKFGQQRQISVTWDPSTYGGKDIFMGIVYDCHQDVAGYLLSQQLSQTMVSELDLSLLPLAKKRQLTRLDGYKEIKGLSCALQSTTGINIMDFKVPAGLLWRTPSG